MDILSWAHTELECHKDGILVLSVLSSIITIGIFMNSSLNLEINNWYNLTILIFLAINTIITIILARQSRSYKKQMKAQCDSHVGEMVELVNITKRLKDNLEQLNNSIKEKEIKKSTPNGMHKALAPLEASIVLMEDTGDLIKQAVDVLKKNLIYNYN